MPAELHSYRVTRLGSRILNILFTALWSLKTKINGPLGTYKFPFFKSNILFELLKLGLCDDVEELVDAGHLAHVDQLALGLALKLHRLKSWAYLGLPLKAVS